MNREPGVFLFPLFTPNSFLSDGGFLLFSQFLQNLHFLIGRHERLEDNFQILLQCGDLPIDLGGVAIELLQAITPTRRLLDGKCGRVVQLAEFDLVLFAFGKNCRFTAFRFIDARQQLGDCGENHVSLLAAEVQHRL